LSASPNRIDYLVLGFDNIYLKNDLWNYDQNNLAVGFHYWISDIHTKMKLDYLRIKGKFKVNYLPDNSNPLVDNGFVVSPEILYGVYPGYYGVGYIYFSQKGSQGINSNQVYIRLDYYPHYKFLISLIPSVHYLSDHSKYISLQSSFTYYPFYQLSVNSTFSLGARKFYYHPDLMVLYNQLETQKANYSFRLDYNFYKNLNLSLVYQKSKFSTYSIDYFVIGLKSTINF
jgi:hypothetical protein